nr:uncharacterized protein LOC111501933 [Leptinotarsa decemlineata]
MPDNENAPEPIPEPFPEIEPYKLSEIFSIVPEFEGDQIFLTTFTNACDCAYQMSTRDQRNLLTIHIKNKLRGRAAQLISSRNPETYQEIRHLLNLNFGDTRDLTSLIQDLQRLKQLPNETALIFFNRLQVHNAKMHACIQKSTLTADQKTAQSRLIETMTLNSLFTGLEPRLGQIIRAGNPRDMLEAHMRIRRELQLSYFENQKHNKHNQQKNNISKRPQQPQSSRTCNFCGRFGHLSNECRQRQRPPPNNTNSFQNTNFPKPNFPQQNRPQTNFQTNQQRPQFQNNQQRPRFQNTPPRPNFQNQNQNRPSVIQRNPNSNQQRTHCVTYEESQPLQDYNTEYENYYTASSQENDYYTDNGQCPQEYDQYDQYDQNDQHDQYINNPNISEYQDFLSLPTQHHPPDFSQSQGMTSDIQTQIQSMNLEDYHPDLNFPEQRFM